MLLLSCRIVAYNKYTRTKPVQDWAGTGDEARHDLDVDQTEAIQRNEEPIVDKDKQVWVLPVEHVRHIAADAAKSSRSDMAPTELLKYNARICTVALDCCGA